MNKRFLSVIITLCLIIACFAPNALALSTFSDVLTPDHDWASAQIEEMADLGIIKGYTGGTFRPDNAITKIEALLLFSRVAGYSNTEYAAIADYAYSQYEYVLDDIDLGSYSSFKKELAFALYKKILSDEEMTEYLADEAYSDEFPRSDAAIFLSNLLNANVKKVSADSLDFDDAEDIPEKALPYVAYVVNEKLMNGVAQTDGKIKFDADAPLSRAQVSVLLFRIIEKLDMSVESGIVTKIDSENGVLEFTNNAEKDKSYLIPDSAEILVDGVKDELKNISVESKVTVVRHGKDIFSVEAINPISNSTLKGTVTAASSKATYMKLSVKLDDTGEEKTFYTKSKDELSVTSDGVADEFSSIKTNDFVVVKLLDSVIVSIDRQTSEATVQGVVDDITLTSPIELTVITTDETSDRETSAVYTVDEDASIRKDDERASLREVLVGDKVILTIKRGLITKIVATGSKSSVTGTITSLTIASQSKVKISSNGVETEYPISIDTSYVVGGSNATIYDLRLGNVITLSLSGSTVTKLEQTSASTATTKSGMIESTSTSYGYINIITQDGNSDQIFASKTASSISAKIIDGETGKEIVFKNLKKNDYIIATGSYANGAFVAKTIVVTPSAD